MDRIKTTEIAIIGAGPAGLAAAIEATKARARATLIDENARPGGQLFKQIHKFFGSQAHGAGVRGFQIGQELCAEAEKLGVELLLNTTVYGLFEGRVLGLMNEHKTMSLKAEKIIIATGATENALPFPGWTLPGVMTAGAAQTMMNIHRVLPGKRVLMVGGGNVGLIVAYQLMQAGAELIALVEAASQIGGYQVHAAKLERAGAKILTSHSIKEARGKNHVESAVIAKLNPGWQPIEGTEREFEVDTICLSVGLTPLAEIALMAGCEFRYAKERGGHVPVLDEDMQTTLSGIYVAGDAAGVDEASIAMEEGRIAGIAAAESLGYIESKQAKILKAESKNRLFELKQVEHSDLSRPVPTQAGRRRGEDGGAKYFRSESPPPDFMECNDSIAALHSPIPIIECTQYIPCNPCETSCPSHAIIVGKPITNLPKLDPDKCTGCGICIACCPGLAIVLLDMTFSDTESLVTIPYEYLPMPRVSDEVDAVNRYGETLCKAKVIRIRNPKSFAKTALVSIAVPKQVAIEVKGIMIV
ncbi:TPA: FAD-dependent oxidoreductase [Candidatus Poribacteria bacterium]|nr:FAD-dependent oxidoreductase [Candidatus Poribacteria bacterium]